VASSHGEIGEGGNEADDASENTGNRDEVDDTVAILSRPAAVTDSLEATADEDRPGRKRRAKAIQRMMLLSRLRWLVSTVPAGQPQLTAGAAMAGAYARGAA